MNEIDTYVPIAKQYKMMTSVLNLYNESLKLIDKGIPISRIKELGLFEEYIKIKFNIADEDLFKFDEFDKKVRDKLKEIEEEYKEHSH